MAPPAKLRMIPPHRERQTNKPEQASTRLADLKIQIERRLASLEPDDPLRRRYNMFLDAERRFSPQSNLDFTAGFVASAERFLNEMKTPRTERPVQQMVTAEEQLDKALDSKIVEIFPHDVAHQPAPPHIVQPSMNNGSMSPTTQRVLIERQELYTKYQKLLREQVDLRTELKEHTSWWQWMKRNSLQVDLGRVEQAMSNFEKNHPWIRGHVPIPLRNLATATGRTAERQVLHAEIQGPSRTSFDRQQQFNKYVATERADAVQELEQKLSQRKAQQNSDPNERYQYWLAELRKHRTQKPRLFGVGIWQKRQDEIERNLAYYRTLKRHQPEAEIQAKAA